MAMGASQIAKITQVDLKGSERFEGAELRVEVFKAMPEGGEIRIACAMNGEKLVLSVADTGHGIPESIRDRIFLPFYTTKERGTGLGLAIVHKIIVSHGGSIRAESLPGGTIFYVTLPKEMMLTGR